MFFGENAKFDINNLIVMNQREDIYGDDDEEETSVVGYLFFSKLATKELLEDYLKEYYRVGKVDLSSCTKITENSVFMNQLSDGSKSVFVTITNQLDLNLKWETISEYRSVW